MKHFYYIEDVYFVTLIGVDMENLVSIHTAAYV